MTKRVLIITSKNERTVGWPQRERYVQAFCDAVTNALDDAELIYTTYDNLEYAIINGHTTIWDSRHKFDIKEAQLVHFKNWEYNDREAPVIARYLHLNGVAFFNAEVGQTTALGKLWQMVLLSAQNLPVPDTFYASKERLKQLFAGDELPAPFRYPLIMKANDGSRGDDNHLIHSAEQALDILTASDPHKEYILQTFIPNDGDFRFLFIGLDEKPLVFHRKGAAGTHLNNTSKGGTGHFYDLSEIPPAHVQYARRAAEVLGREIGGVDILVDKKTNKAYILEVNGTPALATGYGTDTKLTHFVRFVRQTMEGREEE
ncbi:MAG TPA: hypothetical protein VLF91_02410 [Candidatus Saccharimonadales bacterium]|nr:hypothetical protein [Candidatus Saccharimonadales bacterium]